MKSARRTVDRLSTNPRGSRPSSDEMAVLDGELKVRGVDGLRVVDASAIPDMIGSNPQRGSDHDSGKGFGHDRGEPILFPAHV